MKPVVAIIAPGAMGAGVGQRLTRNGIEVRTCLAGRSAASATRARAACMRPVDEQDIAKADILLSILPPGEAKALAEQFVPLIARANNGLVYADCNAVSPQTAIEIGALVADGGIRFVDAGIIGSPPKPEGSSREPTFYASGPYAETLAVLSGYGLNVKVLDAPVGAASGLKMSYAGMTKGTTAIAAAMILAATRFGAAADLRRELAESRPDALAGLQRTIPEMFPKAYRWVAEMEEIADFAGEDTAARQMFEAIARIYQRLAADREGEKVEVDALTAFLQP